MFVRTMSVNVVTADNIERLVNTLSLSLATTDCGIVGGLERDLGRSSYYRTNTSINEAF